MDASDSDVITHGTQAPFSDTLEISKVALYQTTELLLMDGRETVDSPYAKLVSNKAALIRIFVSNRERWQSQTVSAEVFLTSVANTEGTILRDEKTLSHDSIQGDLDSTLNLLIPASKVAEGLSLKVSIHQDMETRVCDQCQWPSTGLVSVAVAPRATLSIVLVPVVIDTNDTVFVPDTSGEAICAIEDRMYALYPVGWEDLEIDVSDPFEWDKPVLANGAGWPDLLDALAKWRKEQYSSAKVYVVGLVAPGTSGQSFCENGCNTGRSYLSVDPADALSKVAVVLGFDGVGAGYFMVHELGHNHGILHAPCGKADDVDWDYPYEGGSIGVWGYDLMADELKDPTRYTDFMGYCDPQWVSDYVYGAIQDWIQQTAQL